MKKVLPYFFCCQLSTLGLLRQTPTYSLWNEAISSYPVFSLWIARIVSVIVVLFAVHYFYQGKSLLQKRGFLIANGLILFAGFIVTFFFSQTVLAYTIGQIGIGFSHAYILLCWAEFLVLSKRQERNRWVAVSALLAALIFLCIGIVPDHVKLYVFLLITLGSFIPLVFLPHRGTDPSTPPTNVNIPSRTPSIRFAKALASDFRTISWELVLLMLCYALLYRIMVFFELSAGYGEWTFVWGTVIRIIGMAALLFYLARKRFEPNIRQIILPLFFLTATGLVLFPGASGLLGAFSVALVESSWTFFYTIIWLILLELSQKAKVNPMQLFALGWGILNTLLLLAAPLAYLFQVQVSEGVLSLTALSLVIAYTLLVGLLLFGKKMKSPLEPAAHTNGLGSDQDWKLKQEELLYQVAEDHGLTKRETEVFVLLAQGYSLPAIENRFVLSHSTVKGHARHVYEKLGVRNKQELIRYVNSLVEQ